MKIETKIKRLFKTWNFTIIYTDNQDMNIYEWKHKMNNDWTEHFEDKILFRIEDYNSNTWYIPDSTKWLVEALWGNIDTF